MPLRVFNSDSSSHVFDESINNENVITLIVPKHIVIANQFSLSQRKILRTISLTFLEISIDAAEEEIKRIISLIPEIPTI